MPAITESLTKDIIVRRMKTSRELDELFPHWRQLAQGQPLNAPGWLGTWWHHFGKLNGRELCVLAVTDRAGELIAVAPWYIETSSMHGRTLRCLGSSSICTDYQTIVCKPNRIREAVDAIAQWLAGEAESIAADGSSRWDLLHLECVHTDDTTMHLFVDQLKLLGATADVRTQENCWRLSLPADWDSYLAMLSKSHRKRVRRLERTYLATGRARLQTVRNRDELELGFDILTQLHALRWESKQEPGIFDDPLLREFHQSAIENFLADGQLRLSWLELDGRPIAADYSFVGDGVLYAYQSGMDPQAAEHQPGNLALIAMLQAAIDEGLSAVDFLRGDEPYKQHWRAEPCRNAEIRLFAPHWSSQMRHTLWRAARSAKDSLRVLRRRLMPAATNVATSPRLIPEGST